jgi:hypothetical protein
VDEVIDCFSALPTGVAARLSKFNYKVPKWKTFYKCLCLIYEIEAYYFQINEREENIEYKI